VLMLFFTEMFYLLVEQTNIYYQPHLDWQARPSRWLPDVTLPDMMTFITLALQMGHTLKDTLNDQTNSSVKSSNQLCCCLWEWKLKRPALWTANLKNLRNICHPALTDIHLHSLERRSNCCRGWTEETKSGRLCAHMSCLAISNQQSY
jgi:hypothetical protein